MQTSDAAGGSSGMQRLGCEEVEVVEGCDHFASRHELLEVSAILQRAVINDAPPEIGRDGGDGVKRRGTKCWVDHGCFFSSRCATACPCIRSWRGGSLESMRNGWTPPRLGTLVDARFTPCDIAGEWKMRMFCPFGSLLIPSCAPTFPPQQPRAAAALSPLPVLAPPQSSQCAPQLSEACSST